MKRECAVAFLLILTTFNGCISSDNHDAVNTLSPTPPNVLLECSQNKWAIVGGYGSDGAGWFSFVKMISDTYHITKDDFGFPDSHIFVMSTPRIQISESRWTVDFTKAQFFRYLQMINELSPDPANATILVVVHTHGTCIDTNGAEDLRPHSGFYIVDSPPIWGWLWDYELRDALDNYTMPTQKIIIVINACQSGNFAAQDTTGLLYGRTDFLYTPCSGPNRIVITGATAPLAIQSIGAYAINDRFLKEGLAEGKGDTNPINGNHDGKTSVEEAWFYYKSCLTDAGVLTAQPCMNDQCPAENPEEEMFLT